MLGFIIGAACAIGIGRMLRRRAWRARYHFNGCEAGCPGGRGAFGRTHRFGSTSSKWLFRALFERLETTPGQERAILSAFEELRANRKTLRDELKETRGDLGRAIESGLVDDTSLEDAFARHDRLLAQLRVGFVESLKKVAEALDAPQRKQLATWLQRGAIRGGWGFPDPVSA